MTATPIIAAPEVAAAPGRPQPAPSSQIATAARAFGDDYPPLRHQWRIRAAGLLLLVTTLLYAPWMLTSLNLDVPWLALPFAAANLFSIAYGLLTIVNGTGTFHSDIRFLSVPSRWSRSSSPPAESPWPWSCGRSPRCSSRIGQPIA